MAGSLGEFDTLFNKNVPHILEKIFLPMDYDSFVSCSKVCKTWAVLLSSEPYNTRYLEKKNNKLCYHAIKGNTKEVVHLLASGADPNCKKGVPLYHAITHCYHDMVKQLLNAGADPNLEKRPGKPPLLLALESIAEIDSFESMDMIKQLLDAGADPNIANDHGRITFDIIVHKWEKRAKKMGEAKGAKIPGEELDTSDEGQKYNRLRVDLARKIQGDLFGHGPVLD